MQCLMQIAAKKVGRRGKLCHVFWVADQPFAVAFFLWSNGRATFYHEHADLRKCRFGYFCLGIVDSIYLHLHVRLSRGDPYFANQYIVDGNCVFSFHR